MHATVEPFKEKQDTNISSGKPELRREIEENLIFMATGRFLDDLKFPTISPQALGNN